MFFFFLVPPCLQFVLNRKKKKKWPIHSRNFERLSGPVWFAAMENAALLHATRFAAMENIALLHAGGLLQRKMQHLYM